ESPARSGHAAVDAMAIKGLVLPLVAAATATAATAVVAARPIAAIATATAAAATVAAAAAAAAATTAVAAAATAAATAIATAATPAAEATAAATAAGRTRLGFVDAQLAAVEVGAVHGGDRRLRVLVSGHLDETEAPRTARFAVGHYLHADDVASIRGERGA